MNALVYGKACFISWRDNYITSIRSKSKSRFKARTTEGLWKFKMQVKWGLSESEIHSHVKPTTQLNSVNNIPVGIIQSTVAQAWFMTVHQINVVLLYRQVSMCHGNVDHCRWQRLLFSAVQASVFAEKTTLWMNSINNRDESDLWAEHCSCVWLSVLYFLVFVLILWIAAGTISVYFQTLSLHVVNKENNIRKPKLTIKASGYVSGAPRLVQGPCCHEK